MSKRLLFPLAVVSLCVTFGPPSPAGQGKGKPGGGGDPPPDPAIAYLKNGDLMVANEDGSNETLVLAADRGVVFGRPSWSPDGTTLVFASNISGPGIYTVDGTGLARIADVNRSPASTDAVWSPVPAADGEYKIAFNDYPRYEDGSLGSNADIFLVNPDGSGLENLTSSPDRFEASPTWAPSATRLAIWDIGDDNVLHLDIVVLDIGQGNGGLEITAEWNLTSDTDVPGGLLNDAFVSQPDWAKSQDRIIVHVQDAPELNGGSDAADLWIIDLADPANPTNLTQTPDDDEDHPSWSPDDARVAYQAYQSGSPSWYGLFVLPTAGSGSATRVVRNGSGPDWRRPSGN